MDDNKNNEKTGLEKYGYRSLLRERERASNQKSELSKEWEAEKEKFFGQQQSKPNAIHIPTNIDLSQTEIIHLESKYGVWTVIYKPYNGKEHSTSVPKDNDMGMSIYIGFMPNDTYFPTKPSDDSLRIGLVQTIRMRSGKKENIDRIIPKNFPGEDKRKVRSLQKEEDLTKNIQVAKGIIHADDSGTHIDAHDTDANPMYSNDSKNISSFTFSPAFIPYRGAEVQKSKPRNLEIQEYIGRNRPGVLESVFGSCYFHLRDIFKSGRFTEFPPKQLEAIYENLKAGGSFQKYNEYLKREGNKYVTRPNFSKAQKQRHYKAELEDAPNLQFSAKEKEDRKNSYQVFETSPLVVSGKNKNLYMGSLTWGWVCDEDGKYQLLPFELHEKLSPTFRNVVKKWNATETMKLPEVK